MNTSRTVGARLVWQRPEDLLQPATLQAVLNSPFAGWPYPLPEDEASAVSGRAMRAHVAQVRREPLAGGVSGAHLERLRLKLELEGPARQQRQVSLIFKRMKPDESWLMRSSGDLRCREVQLWSQGLLDDAPRALCVPVLAAAYDDASHEGALLLADVTRWLGTIEDCSAPVPVNQWKQYLDHLARLHAHYWQDARLHDARYALASVEQTLLMLAPATIQAELAAGEAHPYLPVSQAGWEAFFSFGPAAALGTIQRVLDAPAALLADAASVPETLLHGDAWPPNMGVLPGKHGERGRRAINCTILIDWALATAGPASFDPFWLLFAWKQVDTRRGLVYYRERLSQHLAQRGLALSAARWQMLLDLGVVRTVLTCGESMGQAVLFARNPAQRARAIQALGWWVDWAASAVKRRGWDS